MRVGAYNWNEHEGTFDVRLDAENQKESAELVKLGNQIKRPVDATGNVSPNFTYLWLGIPVNETQPNDQFGNRKNRRH